MNQVLHIVIIAVLVTQILAAPWIMNENEFNENDLEWQCKTICEMSLGNPVYESNNSTCICDIDTLNSVPDIDWKIIKRNAKIIGMNLETREHKLSKREISTNDKDKDKKQPEIPPTETSPVKDKINKIKDHVQSTETKMHKIKDHVQAKLRLQAPPKIAKIPKKVNDKNILKAPLPTLRPRSNNIPPVTNRPIIRRNRLRNNEIDRENYSAKITRLRERIHELVERRRQQLHPTT